MSRNVTVRAIRPHDTVAGMKQPGDEYERPEDEAKALADKGVLSIATPKAAAKSKA